MAQQIQLGQFGEDPDVKKRGPKTAARKRQSHFAQKGRADALNPASLKFLQGIPGPGSCLGQIILELNPSKRRQLSRGGFQFPGWNIRQGCSFLKPITGLVIIGQIEKGLGHGDGNQ